MTTAETAFTATLTDAGVPANSALAMLKLAHFRTLLETCPVFADAFDRAFLKRAQLGGGLAEWAGKMRARYSQGVASELASAPAPTGPAGAPAPRPALPTADMFDASPRSAQRQTAYLFGVSDPAEQKRRRAALDFMRQAIQQQQSLRHSAALQALEIQRQTQGNPPAAPAPAGPASSPFWNANSLR